MSYEEGKQGFTMLSIKVGHCIMKQIGFFMVLQSDALLSASQSKSNTPFVDAKMALILDLGPGK